MFSKESGHFAMWHMHGRGPGRGGFRGGRGRVRGGETRNDERVERGGPRFGGFGRGGGGRGGRIFGPGDLRLVLLALIKEKPRHGYELIKDLEQKFGYLQ